MEGPHCAGQAPSPRRVAALYIDPRGPYPKIAGVDCWDEARDARLYDGPHPVVAHPPCGAWGPMRFVNKREDSDCGIRAFEQVRRFGGILEQPKGSLLFAHCGAPMPGGGQRGSVGETIEVEQVAWGHVARKRTWLFLVGVDRDVVAAGLRTGGIPTHWCWGTHTPGQKSTMPRGVKAASAQQRRRTPPLFAEWLVSLARSVTPLPLPSLPAGEAPPA